MLATGAGTIPGRAGIANDMLNLTAHGVVAGRSSSAHGVVNGSEGVALSPEDESGGNSRSGIIGIKRRYIYNEPRGANIPVRLQDCQKQLSLIHI